MREIKFRGKNKLFGWVYGQYFKEESDFNNKNLTHFIVMNEKEKNEIYQDTLSQYTGLNDIKGKEIYEGDIVKTYDGIGVVEFVEFGWAIMFKDKLGQPLINYLYYEIEKLYFIDDVFNVIGNIYENKELLEG